MDRDQLFKTWAEIDLAAVRHNLLAIRRLVGKEVKILISVKADAYGHGARDVSAAALSAGADMLGVSHVKEALELRSCFPSVPIMILSSGMVGHSPFIVRNDLTPVVCSLEIARDIAQEALSAGKRINVHAMIDTGMGRIGVWHENCLPLIERLSRIKGIRLDGICSHLASADDPDTSFLEEQLSSFLALVRRARARGVVFPLRHIANSAAILASKKSWLDMVRPGIMLYGIPPAPQLSGRIDLRPALSLKARVAFLKTVEAGRTISYGRTYRVKRKTRIATLPIGYGDGFSRAHSNRGEVLIRGRRSPIVGIVTMDQLMVDVGKIPGVAIGDEAVLIGAQGEERITATDAASRIGTIAYEVLAQLGKRVSRVYKG